jgi:tRNA dimethylallyltransferase
MTLRDVSGENKDIRMQGQNRKIVAAAGPTAVGKTEYMIGLALDIDAEIVSCDSMQLYKYMDIGSAKPTAEERAAVRHYLVDEIDPREPFTVAKYQRMAKEAIEEIFSKGKIPLVTGGTGLYLNSLLYDMDFGPTPSGSSGERREELYAMAAKQGNEAVHRILEAVDPLSAERIHPNNLKRVVRAIEAAESGEKLTAFDNVRKKTDDYDVILIGLCRDRAELYERIDLRVDMLMEQGLLEEVKMLRGMGFTTEDIAMKGIGYKEILDALDGRYSLEEAVDTVKKNTRHYAKRQMTWFKRYDEMKWFDLTGRNKDEVLGEIREWVNRRL